MTIRRLFTLCLTVAGALFAGALVAQTPLTPFANLMVRANAAGALAIASDGDCGTLGPLTNGANVRVKANAAGALMTCGDGGATPTVANVGANSCGTTAATIAGNNLTGIVTVGATSGTQCRIAFSTAATTRRECVVTNETTANLSRTAYVDTTHTDLLGVFVAGDTLAYLCAAY